MNWLDLTNNGVVEFEMLYLSTQKECQKRFLMLVWSQKSINFTCFSDWLENDIYFNISEAFKYVSLEHYFSDLKFTILKLS